MGNQMLGQLMALGRRHRGKLRKGSGKRWLKPPETSSSNPNTPDTLTERVLLSAHSAGRGFFGARDSPREEEQRLSKQRPWDKPPLRKEKAEKIMLHPGLCLLPTDTVGSQ